jgi:phenylpropionate dioxygenase-like ring-hydroxylating dioxygenase large terminal subunit
MIVMIGYCASSEQLHSLGTREERALCEDDMISDAETWNGWHVVARSTDIQRDHPVCARLLEQDIELSREANGQVRAALVSSGGNRSRQERERYGLIWVSLGEPNVDVLPFPEFDDQRFTTVLCGPYGVGTSALRVVENFLDMAHLPYVHSGILGQEPHTEVPEYNVARGTEGEGPIATNCLFLATKPVAWRQNQFLRQLHLSSATAAHRDPDQDC